MLIILVLTCACHTENTKFSSKARWRVDIIKIKKIPTPKQYNKNKEDPFLTLNSCFKRETTHLPLQILDFCHIDLQSSRYLFYLTPFQSEIATTRNLGRVIVPPLYPCDGVTLPDLIP